MADTAYAPMSIVAAALRNLRRHGDTFRLFMVAANMLSPHERHRKHRRASLTCDRANG